MIYSHSKTQQDLVDLSEATYFHSKLRNLKEDYLRSLFLTSTIYAWTVQNCTEQVAKRLHTALRINDSYCGWHEVDLMFPKHLVLYNNSMISKYRIVGRSCNVFYSMGEEDGQDEYEIDELRKLGFNTVILEDTGAHGTIFDEYDTPDFFNRLLLLEKLLENLTSETAEVAGEFIILLQDLNPGLLSTLGAMAKAHAKTINSEDLAQVAISARRFIEQLSDPLFEPSEELYKGMSVERNQYKNRLLAYIDRAIPESTENKSELRDEFRVEIDHLIDTTNKGLHAEATAEEIGQLIGDLTLVAARVLRLNPELARNPYFGFSKKIDEFFRRVVENSRNL